MPRVNAVSFREMESAEAICRLVKRAGYDSLELSRPHFYESLDTAEKRREFADFARDLGLSLFGFDCWVDVDPFHDMAGTLVEFDRAVEWAADLDLKLLISHDPWNRVNAGRSERACLDACLELFRPVLDSCEAKGLKLVLEPHPDTHSMDDRWAVELIDRLAKGRSADVVGLVYDCCHYGVGNPNGYLDVINALGRRIHHVHFSDGDRTTYGLHLPLGEGDLNLEGIVEMLSMIGYRGTLTTDLYQCPSLEDAAARCAPRIAEIESRLGLAPTGPARMGSR